ncbi:MAG: hypothetical protein AVDCRST_MAG93-5333 [uncultured Chloroflexia bacterium]|uniref:Uncharacterized protein n=1 Tax=uncultured Chloroflexia bacterium TaxID=1672391 RepID=A0A6J4KRZ5_9CHLR|nr:MAG: hypothetical protein AVDCRST_MAG93-5333 [uncultured Chloroflexia bacterium]
MIGTAFSNYLGRRPSLRGLFYSPTRVEGNFPEVGIQHPA